MMTMNRVFWLTVLLVAGSLVLRSGHAAPGRPDDPNAVKLGNDPGHPDWVARGKVYRVKAGRLVTTDIGRAYINNRRPRGRLRLIKLKSGPGFVVANPKRAWGTRLSVYHLNRVMALYHKRFPDDPPVIIRDLSKRRGGPLPNHASHQDGRDVDIPLILDKIDDIANPGQRKVNAERTWFILKQLVDSCDLDFVFLGAPIQKQLYEYGLRQGIPKAALAKILQYPSKEMEGVVVHWPRHLDHMHVRFRRENMPLMKGMAIYCGKEK